MTKQLLAHTLKMSSVLLRNRTALTGTTDESCLSTLPPYAYERKDRKTAGNKGFAIAGGQWLIGALCFYQSSVLADSLVFLNARHRKPPNR